MSSKPTVPIAAMLTGRDDRRISSNCAGVTAFDPPAMARATRPTRR